MNSATKAIRASLKENADALKALALKVHQNPELGLQEAQACAWQVALLREWGFRVKTPFAGLRTAFKAVFGHGKPTFCIMSEYDALPEIGHACGHNLICTSALGAGKALADAMKQAKMPGTLVVMGTPGEEGEGGKVLMIEKAALKGIDAVIMAHPGNRTVPDTGCNGVARYRVDFKGQAAHAAAVPEEGRNALDAVLLVFEGVNAWRQQLPETCRIHGVVEHGGTRPNIIPDHASCCFYLRAAENAVIDSMIKRFKNIVQGAALMTETTPEIHPTGVAYKPRIPNAALNEAFMNAAKAAGLHPEIPPRSARASSDFGDVSQIVPAAHCYFGITKTPAPGHSPQFAKAAGTAYAIKQTLRTAETMAAVGFRYFSEPEYRKQVADSFHGPA